MATNKYCLYCETDSKLEHVIADSEPTQCPVDAGHTVRSGSVILVQRDVLIRDGSPMALSLSNYKQLRHNEIDGKSLAMLAPGFSFDGHTFSLSIPAQTNWNTLKDSEADFTWPVDVTTIDNDTYSLAQADLSDFWAEARDAVKDILDSGRQLKKQIFDAVDEAAVDAVVDTR